MPWLSILMAILSFLGTLKKDKSNVAKAALTGAAAGLGTYWVTHNTDWGRENLGEFDGVIPDTAIDPATDGSATTYPPGSGSSGTTQRPAIVTTPPTNAWDVLSGWGPTGTAAVIGTAGVASGAFKIPSWVWLAGGVLLITRL